MATPVLPREVAFWASVARDMTELQVARRTGWEGRLRRDGTSEAVCVSQPPPPSCVVVACGSFAVLTARTWGAADGSGRPSVTDRASGWPRFRDSPGPQEQREDGDGVPLDNLTPWNQPHRRETRFPAQGTAAPPGRAGGGPDEWQRGVWAARPSLGWPAPSSEPCCDAGCLSSCPLSTCSGPGRGPGAGVGKQSQPDLCQSTPSLCLPEAASSHSTARGLSAFHFPPGLPLPRHPLQRSPHPAGWVGPGLRGRCTARAPPESVPDSLAFWERG